MHAETLGPSLVMISGKEQVDDRELFPRIVSFFLGPFFPFKLFLPPARLLLLLCTHLRVSSLFVAST